MRTGPPLRKAKLPPDLAKYTPPESVFDHVMVFDWKKINEKRASDLERWNKEVVG